MVSATAPTTASPSAARTTRSAPYRSATHADSGSTTSRPAGSPASSRLAADALHPRSTSRTASHGESAVPPTKAAYQPIRAAFVLMRRANRRGSGPAGDPAVQRVAAAVGGAGSGVRADPTGD